MPRDTYTEQSAPVTDSYDDPLDVTLDYLDSIDSEYDGTVLAYFNHWGTCSEDPTPTLVAVAMIEDGERDFLKVDGLPVEFALHLEEMAGEVVA